MSDFVLFSQTAGKDANGNELAVAKGINRMLVTHFETTPQGGALLHMMGGATVQLDKAQWDVVGKRLAPSPEPQGQAPKSQ